MMTSLPDIEKNEDSTRVADHAHYGGIDPMIRFARACDLLNQHGKNWR